jgi:hypothetical protein
VQLHAVTRILKYGSVKFSAIINEWQWQHETGSTLCLQR